LSAFSLLPDPPNILALWRDLCKHHEVKGKQVHDARLVALMEAHQVQKLLTFNIADFQRYS
jgi:predicted nucleic acid-binding protein